MCGEDCGVACGRGVIVHGICIFEAFFRAVAFDR